jgi:hypothetical protein
LAQYYRLGFIERVEGRYSDEKVKEICNFFALFGLHLEYAARISDPALRFNLNGKQNTKESTALRKNRHERAVTNR